MSVAPAGASVTGWAQPSPLPLNVDPAADASTPQLVVDGATAWMAWLETAPNGSRQVHVATLTPSGWQEVAGGARINAASAGIATDVSLAVRDGTAIVTWAEGASVHVKRLTDPAGAWERVGSAIGNAAKPLVRMVGATVYLAYAGGGAARLERLEQDAWTTVDGDIRTDPAGQVTGAIDLVPCAGDVHLAWAETDAAGRTQARVGTLGAGGVAETVPGSLNDDTARDAADVALACPGGTALHAGWTETTATGSTVRVKRLTGGAWVPAGGPSVPPPAVPAASLADLTAIGDGLYAAWNETTPAGTVAHVSRRSPEGAGWYEVGATARPLALSADDAGAASSLAALDGIPMVATTHREGAGLRQVRAWRVVPRFGPLSTVQISATAAVLRFTVATWGVDVPVSVVLDGLGPVVPDGFVVRSPPAGEVTIELPVSGLRPATAYEWRVLALAGTGGAVAGPSTSFMTAGDGAPAPPAPAEPDAPAPLLPIKMSAPLVSPPAKTAQLLPVARKTVVVRPVSGKVLVRRPGSSSFVELGAAAAIPVGSVIDTLAGRVALTAAGGATGRFDGGRFAVTQSRQLVTSLTLRGRVGPCFRGTRIREPRFVGRAARVARKRKLWGDGKGRFRTVGKHSAAIVRGTKWLVEDRCDGTLTRVVRGTVTVQPRKTGKRRVVRAGQRVLVRAPR